MLCILIGGIGFGSFNYICSFAFPILGLSIQGLGLLFKFNVGNYKLFLEFLTTQLQTCYILSYCMLGCSILLQSHVICSCLFWRCFKSLWVFQLSWLSSLYICCKISVFLATCSTQFNFMDKFQFSYCVFINYV